MSLENLVDQIQESLIMKMLVRDEKIEVVSTNDDILISVDGVPCISIYNFEIDKFFVFVLNMKYRDRIYNLYSTSNSVMLYGFENVLDMLEKIL